MRFPPDCNADERVSCASVASFLAMRIDHSQMTIENEIMAAINGRTTNPARTNPTSANRTINNNGASRTWAISSVNLSPRAGSDSRSYHGASPVAVSPFNRQRMKGLLASS